MKKTFLLLLCVISALNISAQKPAIVANDKPGWHKIGETTVEFTKDYDELGVLLANRFSALKFIVGDVPVEILDVEVYFKEGDKQSLKIGQTLKKAGSESKVIDLKGGAERTIDKIAFHYKTVPNNKDKKARIEIWGKKTNAEKEKSQKEGSKKTSLN